MSFITKLVKQTLTYPFLWLANRTGKLHLADANSTPTQGVGVIFPP